MTLEISAESLDVDGLKEILLQDYQKEGGFLNMLPVATYVCDAKGIIKNYNDHAAILWGRTPISGNKDERFCGAWRLYLPDGTRLPHEASPVAGCLSDGLPRENVELIFERPDFTRVTVNVNILPVLDGEGHVTGMISCFYEITGRKETEKLLKQNRLELEDLLETAAFNEEQYLSLLQTLPTAVYTTDNEGHVTMYNEAAAELWGREPVIGKDLWCGSWKIYNPSGTPLPLDNCPMAIAVRESRPVYGHEIVVERPDGSRRNVLPYPRPLYDRQGNTTGAVNMLVDITEYKNVEQDLRSKEARLRELTFTLEKKVEDRTADLRYKIEELRQSEERYHKMIVEVEDYAIFLLDKNGVIQNWNRGAERIKGYREEEAVGRHIRIFYPPEDRQAKLPEQLIEEAIQYGKALHEGWRIRKNGTRFWASVVITALHDAQNNLIGLTKVTRDLTERKLAEEKIKQYNTDLEFQNSELEQFAYAAAHDMKEPLRKIRFYSNLIMETASVHLPAKETDYLNRCMSAATRMQNLIDDLLTYSKMSPRSYEFKTVDLNECLEEVLQLHHDTIQETRAVIEAGQLPVIKAVPFQLVQLLDNLLGNALKYRHPGRNPCIRISSRKAYGTDTNGFQVEAHVEYYEISISDNGTGFDARYADKIFDLFQRLHDKVNYSGTGIGLAICRKVVQNHKGFISANGEPDKGATFKVYLPCIQ